MITLRTDQADLQSRIFAGWQSGKRNGMAVLPTGGGKSVIVSDTVRRFDDNGQEALVMAHRRELVGQMSLHIARQGVRHRIIAPKKVISAIMAEHRKELNGNCFVVPRSRCSVGSVDTIGARVDLERDYLRRLDLLVCDEGHHALRENKWGAVFEACERALGLLVTATPQRADRKGLGRHADGVADFMELGPDMRWLIDHGALTDYEIVCPPSDFDFSSLKEGEEDFTRHSLKAAADNSPKLVGDVVENYCKYAYGKRAVCFATDVATSVKIAAQFNTWGIPAASVSADTDDTVRDEMVRRLRDGRLWVLVNVDLLGEGFDLPAIECVIMARPTASLAVYMQQFGRALRTLAGKAFGLVIDHVSNVKRHGFPDRKRIWTLDRYQKRKAKEKDPELVDITICTGCGKPYEVIHHACPYCGHVEPLKPSESGGRGALEMVKGDLTRLDAATLAKLRAAADLPDPETMAGRAAFAGYHAGIQAGQRNIATAKIEAQETLKEALSHWSGFQRDVYGRDDSEIHRRFYHATGVDVLSALSADRSDMLNLAERIKSWITV
mgnify:CR=1 FL=1